MQIKALEKTLKRLTPHSERPTAKCETPANKPEIWWWYQDGVWNAVTAKNWSEAREALRTILSNKGYNAEQADPKRANHYRSQATP